MTRLGLTVSASTMALLLGVAFDAQAQNAMLSPPPETYHIDDRGVDLLTGKAVRNARLVSIGQPGAGGLAYDRTWVNGYWRDNVTGTMTATGTDRSIISVSIGGVTDVFTKSGTTYTPRRNVGQTLTLSGSTYTYRTSDGVEYLFSKSLADQRLGVRVNQADEARLSRITRPNGEIISFFYEIAEEWGEVQGTPEEQKFWAIRLREVSNNFGYALQFDYVLPSNPNYLTYSSWQRLQKVTGYNKAQCAGEPASCTGYDWPSVTFNGGSATDQGGRTTFYGASGVGQLVLRLPANPTVDAVKYTTDSPTQRVTSVTQAGSVWSYAYNESGGVRTVTVTDPNAGVATAQVDTSTGLLKALKDPLNRQTGFAYDSSRRLTRVTYPQANFTSYAYDARGNVTRITASPPPSVTATPLEVSATYPVSCANNVACNQPDTTTDARGAVTNYTYDGVHGGVLTITAPAATTGGTRPQTRISYAVQTAYYMNSSGVIAPAPSSITLPTAVSTCAVGTSPSCVGTANESRTTFTYGAAGVANNLQPTVIANRDGTGALSAATTLTYTPMGDVASVNGPLAGTADTTLYRYDDARQLIGMVSPDPDGSGALLRRAQRYTYNADGAVTLAEQGTVTGTNTAAWNAFSSLQRVATAYDANGRPTHQRAQSGSTTHSLVQTSYDAAGRPDCVTQRMNPASFASPPASACTLATAGAFGPDRVTKFGYDVADQLTSTIVSFGTGASVTEKATYTANGLPLTLTDGQGNVSTMVYDGFDRLSRLLYPNASGGGSSTTDDEEYTYDAGGNVLTYRNRAGELIGASYDNLGRRVALGGSAIADQAFGYDNLGRPTSVRFTSLPAQDITYTWDALGRQTSESGPLGQVGYQYDLAGRRTRITWPDAFYADYDYDLYGQVTRIRENGATSGTGVVGVYAYDNLGRRAGLTRSNGVTTAYGYDSAGRLASLAHDLPSAADDLTMTFAYNPAGQIISRTMSNAAYVSTPGTGSTSYANNGRNQVTSVGGTAVTYDARQNIASASGQTYTYDGLNRLKAVAGIATYAYDPAGRLYEEAAASTQRFLYAGDQVIAALSVGGTIVNRFVPGPGVDERITWRSSSDTRYWPITDERGSVQANLFASGAILEGKLTYDEYGVPSSTNSGRFGYTGQMRLTGTELYHYKARAYNPNLGRFMQSDPIGYSAGLNLYSYVGNDPINWADPLGLCPDNRGDPECPDDANEVDEVEVVRPRPILGPGYIGGLSPTPGFRNSQSSSQAPWVDPIAVNGVRSPAPSYVWTTPRFQLIIDGRLVWAWTAQFQIPVYQNASEPSANDPSKTPGRPSSNDGYRPPRRGAEWVRNPNGGGYGWLDRFGNVWVPTGPRESRAHGGPHWDVQNPRTGRHVNIYPGGSVR